MAALLKYTSTQKLVNCKKGGEGRNQSQILPFTELLPAARKWSEWTIKDLRTVIL